MKSTFIYLSWLISIVATSGSLYFSNVLMFPPCSLCWWQRICMFPLVLLFSVGFIKKDKASLFYTAPLIFVGLIISIYHNLLYYGIIEKSLSPCSAGASCTSIQIEWFGFITIPLLALVAFTLLGIICLISILNKDYNHEK